MIMIWLWLSLQSNFWLWFYYDYMGYLLFDYDYVISALDYDFLISNHNHAHVCLLQRAKLRELQVMWIGYILVGLPFLVGNSHLYLLYYLYYFLLLLLLLLLLCLIHFRVAECVECKMPISNLAKVFGPTLVGYSVPEPQPEVMVLETHMQQRVKKLCI